MKKIRTFDSPKEKREVKGYKILPSVYDKAMETCKGGKPLANRIEDFVTKLANKK